MTQCKISSKMINQSSEEGPPIYLLSRGSL